MGFSKHSSSKGLPILIIAIILLIWAGAIFWVDKEYHSK